MAKKQQNTRSLLLPVTPSDTEWDEPTVPPKMVRRSSSNGYARSQLLPFSRSSQFDLPKPAFRVHPFLTQVPPPRLSRKNHQVVLSLLCFILLLGLVPLSLWCFFWRETFRTHLAMNFTGEVPAIVLLPELQAFESGRVVISPKQLLPEKKPERVAYGVVHTSFAKAAKEAGVTYEIVDELVELFSDRIVFDQDFREGDRFTIIYRDNVSEKSTKAGRVLAAAVDVGNKRLVATRFIGTDGKAHYFDNSGQAIGNGFLRYPLQFSRVTSYFSYARFHPILKQYRPHHGVDFAAPVGTPVRSVANGKVTFAGSNGSCGIMVKIDHNDRYSTAYLHLSKIPNGVIKGSFVSRGQIIGAVGATGLVTGPHLHYSFYDRGQYVDPLKIQLPTVDTLSEGSKISQNYLHRVLFTLEHYQDVDSENVSL